MRAVVLLLLAASVSPVHADTVFAAKTLRARAVISTEDVVLQTTEVPGGAETLEDVIGSEVIRAVYAGRPIMAENLASAALIERNQLVRAAYSQNGLSIEIEARALERGAVGDVIRVMNLASRTTIQAEIQQNGTLRVIP